MELEKLVYGAIFVSFLLAVFGYGFGGIFNYYNVTDANVSSYANASALEDLTKNIADKVKGEQAQTSVLDLVTIPFDGIKLFFGVVNIVFAFFNSVITTLGLPSFLTAYVIIFVTMSIVFALYYAVTKMRFGG